MTLGLHDYERRRRRRFWGSTVKFLLILGVLLAIGLFAYQMGVEQVKGREAGLLTENAQLTQTNGELSRSVAGLRAAAGSGQDSVGVRFSRIPWCRLGHKRVASLEREPVRRLGACTS